MGGKYMACEPSSIREIQGSLAKKSLDEDNDALMPETRVKTDAV